ncbi:MAG: hypothetical protein JSU68_06845 [Phycisphaerales bacterium]|nr:MAG: hypothetical protein JSU68_06845 [Phycisphaerales bacterium]
MLSSGINVPRGHGVRVSLVAVFVAASWTLGSDSALAQEDVPTPTPVTSPFTVQPIPQGREAIPNEVAATRLEFQPAAYREMSQLSHARLEGFPLARDMAVTLELQRFTVTGPDTLFIVGTADGDVVVEPPDVTLFKGKVAGYPDSHVFLGLSPHGSNGMIRFGGAEYILAAGSQGAARTEQVHVIYERSEVEFDESEPWRCFTDQLEDPEPLDVEEPPAPSVPLRDCTLKQIDVAIESDWEYRTLFGSSAAALAYANELLGAVSTIYERDVDTMLYLPYVRVWDSDTDPYPAGSTPSQRLSQFRSYWWNNMGSVSRDVAQMLSGVPGGGVAWLSTLCSTWSGYSVAGALNGWFPNPIVSPHSANWDLMVSAHELGHNCSSPHTHCYSPPIDECYNLESGCYSGTRHCTQGTIMSYCHVYCGGMIRIDIEFHTRVQDRIQPYIHSRGCVGCAGVEVSDESPNRGSTVGALPEISVTFNQPVSGVTADDMTVNGSAATSVTGSDEGPYTFSGYAAPAFGTVNVVLAAGGITGTQTGFAFAGDAWTYELVDDCNGNDIPDTEENPTQLYLNLGAETGVLDSTAPLAQDIHMGGVGDALVSGFQVYYRSTGTSPGVMTVRFWENDLLDGQLPGAPLGLLAEYVVGALDYTPIDFGIAHFDVSPYVTVQHNIWMEVEIDKDAGVILRAGPTDSGSTHGMVYDRDAEDFLAGGPYLMGLRLLGVLCPSDCNGNDIPDESETDTDGDDLIDECDECDSDPDKIVAGQCGCGVPETDTDGDQAPDCIDECPNDPAVQVIEAEDPDLGKCDDGVDNDCDGFTDMDDTDCTGPSCICGDLDNSGGAVDLGDFATFANCYGLTAPTPSCEAAQLSCSDMDVNGVVDLNDFATFANLFGLTSTDSPPNCGG